MKEYRIDTFTNGSHSTTYFDTEAEAIQSVQNGQKAFLLKEVLDGKYEVLKAL